MASGSQDGRIRFWTLDAQDNPQAEGESITFKSEGDLTVPVTNLAFSGDGKWLAVCGGSKVVRVWNVETRQEGPALKHDDHVTALRFSPSGTTLVTSDPGKLRIWDVASGKEIAKTDAAEIGYSHVTFSPDGKLLAAAELYSITVWKAADMQEKPRRRFR